MRSKASGPRSSCRRMVPFPQTQGRLAKDSCASDRCWWISAMPFRKRLREGQRKTKPSRQFAGLNMKKCRPTTPNGKLPCGGSIGNSPVRFREWPSRASSFQSRHKRIAIMPHLTTDDGIKLYYEELGAGVPVIFVHEFAGDCRSYEAQVRYFSKHYRCVTFNARGYPPSDVPKDVVQCSQVRARDDIRAVLDALEIDKAHIVGLSMGAFAALHF